MSAGIAKLRQCCYTNAAMSKGCHMTASDRNPDLRGILSEVLEEMNRNVPMELTCAFCGGIAYAFPQPQPEGRIICPRCSFNGASERIKAEREERWATICQARRDGNEKRAEKLHRELIVWMQSQPAKER